MNPSILTTRFARTVTNHLSESSGWHQRGYITPRHQSRTLPVQPLRTSPTFTALTRSFSEAPILHLPKMCPDKPLFIPTKTRVFTPLRVELFSQKRGYSSDDGQTKNDRDWSQKFESFGKGASYSAPLAVAMVAGFQVFMTGEKEKRIESRESQVQRFSESGLTRIQPYHGRPLEDQVEDFKEADKTIMIIGISGLRILDDITVVGKSNPLRPTIINLLEKSGNDKVKVKLMIYNPKNNKLFEGAHNMESEISRAKKGLELANRLQNHYPNFEFKVLDQSPPFHGDLIDSAKAHIAPLPLKGIFACDDSLMTETYVDTKKGKLNYIISDFEYLWEKKATSLKN